MATSASRARAASALTRSAATDWVRAEGLASSSAHETSALTMFVSSDATPGFSGALLIGRRCRSWTRGRQIARQRHLLGVFGIDVLHEAGNLAQPGRQCRSQSAPSGNHPVAAALRGDQQWLQDAEPLDRIDERRRDGVGCAMVLIRWRWRRSGGPGCSTCVRRADRRNAHRRASGNQRATLHERVRDEESQPQRIRMVRREGATHEQTLRRARTRA